MRLLIQPKLTIKRAPSIITLFVLIAFLSACSSVTMRPYGGLKEKRSPDYSDSKDYYFWGLVGEYEINTSKICGDRRVEQMQSITSSSDWVRGVFTFFIYSPRTAKVWCEETPDYDN